MFEKIIYLTQLEKMLSVLQDVNDAENVMLAYIPMAEKSKFYYMVVSVDDVNMEELSAFKNEILLYSKKVLNSNIVYASEFEIVKKQKAIEILNEIINEIIKNELGDL
jgi:hypothetical protein